MIKKIILNITIVFTIVFVLDLSIGRTLRYFYFKESSGLHYRTTFSMDSTKANILIFGSSRATHHYVPEVFESSLKEPYYNTGRDGNGIFYQLAVLRSILKRYNPKVIILDYYPGSFDNRKKGYDRLSSLLPYYRNHKEIRDIVELKSSFEKVKLLSEIYPFNSDILSIIIGNTEYNKKRKPSNKGYISLHGVWEKKIDSIVIPSKNNVDLKKLNAFKEFIRLAKSSDVKVYVIYSPVFRKPNKNNQTNLFENICSSENISFWDYSKDTIFLNNRKLFQDTRHLNHNGAVEFSKFVVDKLEIDLNLSDINKNTP